MSLSLSTKATTLHVKIHSQTEKLEFVRTFISEAAQQFGFDEDSVQNIVLAVDEACTNIIKHSYEYASNKDIDIRIMTDDHRFEIIITHQGKPFDPKSVEIPDMPAYLASYRKGGLGMYIMRAMMDEIEYKKLPNNITEVHLIKYLRNKISR
ncbi:MAG: ATP-binding protein [Ignavibacteriae bacterium]|nr:ATP-binding protein [Ignavibacteriota bacterium]